MRKKSLFSKTNIILALILVFFFGFSFGFLRGNSPENVDLAYDDNAQVLSVTISHDVSDTHYIELVEIWKNDVEIISEEYTSQPAFTFTYNYSVTTTDGDILEARATCNLFGSRTASITIGDTPTTTTQSVPVYQLCIIIPTFLFLGLIRIRTRIRN